MRKILVLFTTILFITAASASFNLVKPPLKASDVFLFVSKSGEKISLMDLSRMKASRFEELTGKKLNVFNRLGFKLAQRNLRNAIHSDGTVDSKKFEKFAQKADGETGFHLGGFALGFLLGLIGVIIAYVIKDEKKRNRVKWAWIGFGIYVVLYIIILAATL